MSWYADTDPMTTALLACALLAAWCWGAAIVSGNYSQVDRLWSVLPVAYVVHFATHAGWADARLNLMVGLVVLWGARLTWNYARKGGYRRGSEDYRWHEVRRRLGPVAFQLLNATFVAPFQNALLLLLAGPAYAAWRARGTPLGPVDAIAATVFLACWVGEAIADEQQWRFQSAKRAPGGAGSPGFCTTGLFRWSRHPNFFCEQGMWWAFALFAVAATGAAGLPWFAGAALLTALFQGSTRLTEALTLARYPAYVAYQRRTSRLLPRPPRGGRSSRGT